VRTPEPRPVTANGLAPVREALLAGLDKKSDRSKIGEALEADDVGVVDGEFPDPYARFVTVNIFGREAPSVRAAFLADADGAVEITVEKPLPKVFGPIHLPSLVDLDGDGRESVLFEVGGHGYTLRWLHFDTAGEPHLETPAHFASGG
ncbi:MAG: hypothetical protein ABEN55_04640, partial [Bradymonadaceae bacterium]